MPYLTGEGRPSELPSDFYRRQILAGQRTGFLYQKLTEPRSYDYRTVENKRYGERLRMPKFPFDVADREAVMTFVLGLVAQPPRAKYLYQPDGQRRALLEGRAVWTKYRCGGCHVLQPERWQIAYPPGTLRPPQRKPTFPFVDHAVGAWQIGRLPGRRSPRVAAGHAARDAAAGPRRAAAGQ